MDTMMRVWKLIDERNISLAQLSEASDVPYSTLKNTQHRNGQLSVDTIERICAGLGISMAEFFSES